MYIGCLVLKIWKKEIARKSGAIYRKREELFRYNRRNRRIFGRDEVVKRLLLDWLIDDVLRCCDWLPSRINFPTQEKKNEYSSKLYTIQEEVRSKFNVLKHEELRAENERYKDLINGDYPMPTDLNSSKCNSGEKNPPPSKRQ
ncbi:hypothetical protein NPIL_229371 [Nephila pilipes]|uniref:Uncharacterized protein n=1 Tax=Nephila pilipes TaxID=299642 RepID=A0A8X6PN74_NEPPI|nr:hypothetical protein NPIL_229371 [Nephila pilipes]